MILNSNHQDDMSVKQPLLSESSQESPPSYDDATESTSSCPSPSPNFVSKPKQGPPEPLIPIDIAGSSAMYTQQPTFMPPPTVYNYVNPSTGETIVSLLPPNHPEMVCVQAGSHVPQTQYGVLGILAAIFWFPLGIGLCLVDRRVKCTRCGAVIEEGICS